MISTAIIKFTCKFSADLFPIDYLFHLQPNFCYLQCNYFHLPLTHWALNLCCTQLIIFHINFPVCAQINTVQTAIKHSLLALNLQAFMPRALEMEKGLPRVTVLRVLIQRNPTAVLLLLPTSLCKALSQQHASDSGSRSGIIEVFIYLLVLHTLVSLLL